MVLGFISLPIFTLIHVLITFVAIGSGFWLMWGFIRNNPGRVIAEIFLTFTFLTSVTGFLFPISGFTPALATGIIAMLALAFTLAAFYIYKLKGSWRTVYVIGAVISLYLNCFVLVVQVFLKVPVLHALAPNGNEPSFAITQGAVLLLFVIIGYLASKRFKPSVFS